MTADDATQAAGAHASAPAGLAGRRAVITGAWRGLGSACSPPPSTPPAPASRWSARSKPLRWQGVALAVGDHLVCAGDVRDELFNETVGERMTERFGGVDVWIANAGVSREDPQITRLSPAAWREVIDTNLTGTFLAPGGLRPDGGGAAASS